MLAYAGRRHWADHDVWDAVGWNGSIALALARWCHRRFTIGRWSRIDVSGREAEQFLAPTCKTIMPYGVIIAGVGKLDMPFARTQERSRP